MHMVPLIMRVYLPMWSSDGDGSKGCLCVSMVFPEVKALKTSLSNLTDGRIANVTFDMADLMEIKLPLLRASKVAHAMH